MLAQDFRVAFRRLCKTPGFTAVAVATLALCIGCNLSVFALIDRAVFRPVSLRDPGQLVALYNSYPGHGLPRMAASFRNYLDRKDALPALASVSIYESNSTIVGGENEGAPSRVPTLLVSPEFLHTVGVRLAAGQGFTAEQTVPGADRVAILTHEYWRSRFNSDPHVIGRTFLNDGVPMTIVGVLAPGFQFLSSEARILRPAAGGEADRTLHTRHMNRWSMIARLAPGARIEQAQAQIDALNAEQMKDEPYADYLKASNFRTIVTPLEAHYAGESRWVLLLLQAGVACVLLIGGANLVNLLLIRASARSKDVAVRQALGAGRLQLAREVLSETLLIGLGGGLLGTLVGAAGIQLLRVLGSERLPGAQALAFDGRVCAAALGLSLLIGLLLALPVIWMNGRATVNLALRDQSRSATGSRAANRVRYGFVIAQVALAFILVACAGLLTLSLRRILESSPGFATEHVLSGELTLPETKYPEPLAQIAAADRVLAVVRNAPGVSQAAATSRLPFSAGPLNLSIAVEAVLSKPGGSTLPHHICSVSGDYHAALRVALLKGRLLADSDGRQGSRVCVVDQAFAERYWPDGDPLGQRLALGTEFNPDYALTIVGVVATMKQTDLTEKSGHGAVYLPFALSPTRSFAIVVRSSMPVETLAATLRSSVLAVDAGLPVDDIRPLSARVEDTLIWRRAPALLAAVFGAIALLLAGTGTYGVLSYAVSQRQREISIRLALGALPSRIYYDVVKTACGVLLVGACAGLLGAWFAGRGMQSVLYGVPTLHAATLMVTAAVLVGVTLSASLLPARRAAKVDPATVLRAD